MSFRVQQGNYGLYGHKAGDDGYTITHDTAMGSIHYWVETIEEVEDAQAKYDPEMVKAQAQAVSDYLTSEEGSWGRQDSFDNSPRW